MIKPDTIFKYRIRLSKEANSITHQEKRAMFAAALAVCGLKCAQNKTSPRFSLGPGAAVTEASLCEFADISLLREVDVNEVKQSLAPHITGGFKIEDVEQVPNLLCAVESIATHALYKVKGVGGDIEKAQTCAAAAAEVMRPDGMAQLVDIKPFIHSINKINGTEIEIKVKLSGLRSVGLRQMLSALPGLEVNEPQLTILRGGLLWQTTDGRLLPLGD
ncbi:MAG: DUF2344 domain-containing protein [Elusimicrobiota bacterium]|jgi:hypothetical protein|nr:DUF2344 domain-containing protein [Elusimicrobiota bacterium]